MKKSLCHMSLFLCFFGISLGQFVEKILPKAGVWKKDKKRVLTYMGELPIEREFKPFKHYGGKPYIHYFIEIFADYFPENPQREPSSAKYLFRNFFGNLYKRPY